MTTATALLAQAKELFNAKKLDESNELVEQAWSAINAKLSALGMNITRPEQEYYYFTWPTYGRDMTAIATALTHGLEKYASPEYNWRQLCVISHGIAQGMDVSIFAKPEFTSRQMSAIKRGLKEQLDVSTYANPAYETKQMHAIMYGLKKQLDVSAFAKPEIDADQMWAILKTLMQEKH